MSRPGLHGDSFLLPPEPPADIVQALNLILYGTAAGASIIVAQFATGSDGVNRNVLAPGEPLWYWHGTRLNNFAHLTPEILDGWPAFIEQDVNDWIMNTGGFIGVWKYNVTAELTPIPLPGHRDGSSAVCWPCWQGIR